MPLNIAQYSTFVIPLCVITTVIKQCAVATKVSIITKVRIFDDVTMHNSGMACSFALEHDEELKQFAMKIRQNVNKYEYLLFSDPLTGI